MTVKPRIIVLSKDDEDVFRWMSDGWATRKHWRTSRAKTQRLFDKVCKVVEEGKDVLDTITRLEKAGFEIVRRESAV